jgi:hypothetical protein
MLLDVHNLQPSTRALLGINEASEIKRINTCSRAFRSLVQHLALRESEGRVYTRALADIFGGMGIDWESGAFRGLSGFQKLVHIGMSPVYGCNTGQGVPDNVLTRIGDQTPTVFEQNRADAARLGFEKFLTAYFVAHLSKRPLHAANETCPPMDLPLFVMHEYATVAARVVLPVGTYCARKTQPQVVTQVDIAQIMVGKLTGAEIHERYTIAVKVDDGTFREVHIPNTNTSHAFLFRESTPTARVFVPDAWTVIVYEYGGKEISELTEPVVSIDPDDGRAFVKCQAPVGKNVYSAARDVMVREISRASLRQ